MKPLASVQRKVALSQVKEKGGNKFITNATSFNRLNSSNTAITINGGVDQKESFAEYFAYVYNSFLFLAIIRRNIFTILKRSIRNEEDNNF